MGNSSLKALGGVSPLKKGEKGAGSGKTTVRKVRAGKVGTRARTNKAQSKSGYSTPGADFINVHAFGPNTRVSSSLADTLGPSLSSAVRGKGDMSTGIIKDELGNVLYDPSDYTVSTEVVPGGKGNEFADNCYNADGTKRTGHKYFSDIKGYEVACEWDPKHKPTGAFDYDKEEKVVTKVTDKKGNVVIEYEGTGGGKTKTQQVKRN